MDRRILLLAILLAVPGCKKKIAPLPGVSSHVVAATHGLLVAGGFDTCARQPDGAFWCWGQNDLGQLGDGTNIDPSFRVITRGRIARCWGHNLYGESGSPSLVMAAPATDVLDDVKQISVSSFESCALRGDGTVWCWGMNDHGELGDGTTRPRFDPRPVFGLKDITRVSVGDGTACALSSTGRVSCWGANEYGTCGVGRGVRLVMTPTAIDLPTSVNTARLTLGGFEACLVADGVARCWGQGDYGALGSGGTRNAIGAINGDPRIRPEVVPGLVATEIAVGHTHACARRDDGVILCWGNNSEGQLGNGTRAPRTSPAAMTFSP